MGQQGRPVRQSLQLALGLAISAGSVWLLLRQVDFGQVWAVLSNARLSFLLIAIALYFVAVTLRAWRWRVMLTPVKRLSLTKIWPVTIIGYAGNVLLPARLGEVLRVTMLRTRGVPMSAGAATVATERMVDGLTTVGLALFTMPLLAKSAPSWLLTAGRAAGAVFAVGLLALWAVILARPRVERLLNRLSERFPLVAKPAVWALRFVDGLAVLRSPVLLGRTLALTALAWTFSILEYWFALASVGVQLPPAGAAFSISAIGLSSALPAGPGYVGTQELVGVTVLGLWNVPAATALAASVTFHVVEIVPIALAGLVVGWREGMLGRLARLPSSSLPAGEGESAHPPRKCRQETEAVGRG